jgi:ribose 5-phosphate isomerase B
MKIAIGSDHAGFQYKEKLREQLTALGHEVRALGTNPAKRTAEAVLQLFTAAEAGKSALRSLTGK